MDDEMTPIPADELERLKAAARDEIEYQRTQWPNIPPEDRYAGEVWGETGSPETVLRLIAEVERRRAFEAAVNEWIAKFKNPVEGGMSHFITDLSVFTSYGVAQDLKRKLDALSH